MLVRRYAPPLTLFFFVTIIALLRCYAGLFGIIAYPHDVFALIDPAWRILHHQIPHIDFYSQLGPLPYLETALGLVLANGGAQGLVYGQVISGFSITVWMYLLAQNRLPRTIGYALTIYVLALGIAPFNIGESYSVLSGAMSYNRLSYAVTAVILIESLTFRIGRRFELLGGISTGVALAFLLFTKITFFGGALFTVAALAFVYMKSRERWLGLLAGFSAVTFALGWFLRFDVAAVWRDYRISAGAKHLGPAKLLLSLLEVGSAEGASLIAFVLLAAIVLRGQTSGDVAKRATIAGFIVLILSSFLLFGNFQTRGLPMNACFALVVAGWIMTTATINQTGKQSIRAVLIGWAFVMAGWPIVSEFAGISYAAMERAARSVPRMRSSGLAGFRIRDKDYASFVDDGVLLASRHIRTNDKIESPDFSDFFSYALRIDPPRGGAACLHFGSTFDNTSHPSPERLFHGAAIVMMPIRFSEEGSQESIPRIYGSFIKSHFHLEATSAQWYLYRRNFDITESGSPKGLGVRLSRSSQKPGRL